MAKKFSRRASIYGISYELGSFRLVNDFQKDQISPEFWKFLESRGHTTYSQFDEPVSAAIKRCVMNCLQSASVQPKEIDGVLIVSESFNEMLDTPSADIGPSFQSARNKVFDILAELGIQAPFFCSTFGGSSNFLQAIFLAKPMIEAEKCRNLLVVCVDRILPGSNRIMNVAFALVGDGIAACILTNETKDPPSCYEIEHVGISPYLGQHENWNRLVLEMYRATKCAAANCYEAIGVQPNDFGWLLLGNYNELSNEVFSRLLGFRPDNTCKANVSRTGHLPSCDHLVNLKDLSESKVLSKGMRLLLYMNGPISCGTIALVQRERRTRALKLGNLNRLTTTDTMLIGS